MSLLEVNDIHTYYGPSYVLQGVDLEIPPNAIVGLFGRNGVGKTTTVRSIVGFTPPKKGTIQFKGENLVGKQPYEIAKAGIGLVPQGRRMFASLNVMEHLTLGYDPRSGGEWTLERIFDLFPRLSERKQQQAKTLSGGEQSMLAIARALLMNPALLVMDEPTEGLAPVVVEAVSDVIRKLHEARQSTLLIEQNVTLALDLVDYCYVMTKGQVAWKGTPAELREQPEIQSRLLGV